jgi:glycosyltransferase involved in cell wall biosynthesis
MSPGASILEAREVFGSKDGSMGGRIVFVMLGKKDFRSGGYIFNFRMVEYLRYHGFDMEVIHFRTVPEGLAGNWLDASRYVRGRIAETRPNLVIVSKSYQYVPLFRLSPDSGRTPVLYMMHHLEWMDAGNRIRSRMYRRYVRWLLGMADRIWANSRNTFRALLEMGMSEERIRVISPGFEKTGPEPPDRTGRSGPVRLLCVGSISPRKAQHILVRACATLDEGSFTLDLAGSTESDARYARYVSGLIDDLGLDRFVRMRGVLDREELLETYRQADVLVHPATWEAFGMSLLEGMWQGLPVVGSDVAAIPELVSDGENGILVPPGSVGDLASSLRMLIDNRETRLEMGVRSRELAAGRNDWEKTGEEFLQLVLETMDTSVDRGG